MLNVSNTSLFIPKTRSVRTAESLQALAAAVLGEPECEAGEKENMRRYFTRVRVGATAAAATLLLGGCGGGETSLNEYVEQVDAVFQQGISEYEVLVATPEGKVLLVGQGDHMGLSEDGARLSDFTPQDLHVAMERLAEIQADAVAVAATIEPPKQVAEIHEIFFRELPIAELAGRAGTAADWEELSASPEMAAYRSALAADNESCAAFQAQLDATTARGAFTDSPWMPNELTEIVEYALGCGALPQNPEDAYRP